jgi:hypothetical protein
MVSIVVLLVSLGYVLRAAATEFYLKIGGTDAPTCRSYQTACESLDYVMPNIVNVTEDSIVYIDSGTYDYSLNGTNGSAIGGYANRAFVLVGDDNNANVDANDISSYPMFVVNTGTTGPAFFFYGDVSGTFRYIKIYVGSAVHSYNRIIMGSFSIYLFIIFFPFVNFF